MKIGVVGTSDSVDKIINVVNEYYPNINVSGYKKEKVEEVCEILDKCLSENDGVLFTGCAVLGEALKHCVINKPYEAVMRMDSSIIKAFWDIKNDGKPIERISIDVVDEMLVKEVEKEFGIKINNLYVIPYDANMAEEEYTRRHMELWKQGKVDIVISALGAVYNELKANNLPVYRLNITTPLVKSSMQSLVNRITTDQIKANQIAIQVLRIKNLKQSMVSQYDSLIKKNTVEKELIGYVKEVQGSFFQLGMDKYIIFSTRRTLEDSKTLNYFQKIIKDFHKQGIVLYSGLGFGNTGWDAEYNAQNALELSEKLPQASLYIIDEKSQIRGPISGENEIEYESYVYDKRMNEIAKQIGISNTYLSKILSIMKKKNESVLSADILGQYLDITERSARRILDKFVVAGYGEEVTTTVGKGIGRPKKIIKINI